MTLSSPDPSADPAALPAANRATRTMIFISVAFSGLAMTVILPILAPLIRELGLSESQGGWMVSIGSVAMVLMANVWGPRSDRTGRKPVILAGFAGLFLAYITHTLVVWLGLEGLLLGLPLFLLLILTRALVGMFIPAATAGAQAYMADITTPAQRSSGMALISAANGVGMVVGPALAGTLALAGLIWPMLLATLLPLIAFLVVRRGLPHVEPRQQPAKARISPLTPGLRNWLVVALMTMTSIVTLQIVAGFYFQDRLGVDTRTTARLLAGALTIVGLVLVLTQTVQIRYLKWQSRRLAMAGAPLMAVGMLIMLNTQSVPAYYLAYAFFGLSGGLLFPAFMSGASLSVDRHHQGAAAGLVASAQGLGAILAPIVSTTLYEYDKALPFTLLIGLMVIAWIAASMAPAPAISPPPKAANPNA
ncbi:MFS transporter [Paracandidimonas soli]|uniref:Putative MFS family arabinose efflux permease n=2 Tax=Paracandidimonas soli TaxID=1917182 RepID=A0A4R3VD25_9BURK|nr:MFS transporter [Paracandidimonas soli]TCV01489.1 putative MFS family arabinose efflux permease [Paracandidimonas soli]